MLYDTYQAHADLMWPWRAMARNSLPLFDGPLKALLQLPAVRKTAAALDVFSLAEVTHKRLPFGIDSVRVHGEPAAVEEEVVLATPFASLLHFKKPGITDQPPLLIAAPMSGHFATLLRETVRTTLRDHDVYITDWHNARDVPLAAGRFGLDEYVEHLMDFMAHIGPGVNLLAICQPCVAALAATALMAEDQHPATPRTLTLAAGPLDCRISPTAVNKLAVTKPISWFEQRLIARVPLRFKGALRRVYPGFVQLSAFMSMNLERHVQSLREMYASVAAGEHDKAEPVRRFYEEYFAVADLPAEFYLETVQRVFQDYDLPLGKLAWRGRPVRPEAIRRTALLTIEGERDDICAVGQTLAAHEMCSQLRPTLKSHYVQPGVGHYGVFSGRRWDTQIYPMMRDVVYRFR
ncbi:polyhydroxyalkanoate depolymerase [Aquincola tertiaricarbonis]|uniref:Polyhydroxyalkanoate depolymerase n=1 Tax=Aquincola tertiaricarbonis TaxID=391953 RepID=A0ABY4S829_AQUTE|nr:polyhydroxyalkanoate depolymerase [Aquincola tertiaricarbonis]URI07460.1 polyhydroxyalkanoate depolymerase [Aquincola tertiaricarbonis]